MQKHNIQYQKKGRGTDFNVYSFLLRPTQRAKRERTRDASWLPSNQNSHVTHAALNFCKNLLNAVLFGHTRWVSHMWQKNNLLLWQGVVGGLVCCFVLFARCFHCVSSTARCLSSSDLDFLSCVWWFILLLVGHTNWLEYNTKGRGTVCVCMWVCCIVEVCEWSLIPFYVNACR